MLIRKATRITPRALRVLSALLLADGNYVSTRQLARAIPERRVPDSGIRNHIANLRRFGVWWIETGPRGGYRLRSLPPDWLLDDLLAMAHRLREERPREAWGRLRLVARGSATTPSVHRLYADATPTSVAGAIGNSR